MLKIIGFTLRPFQAVAHAIELCSFPCVECDPTIDGLSRPGVAAEDRMRHRISCPTARDA